MFELQGKYTTAKVMIDEVEESCIAQIYTFISHPAFTNQIVIQADTHQGKGSVIGFTMPMTDKIVPNVIGVDIGCGMLSTNVGSSLPISFELLDHRIRQAVPFGTDTQETAVIHMKNEFPWHEVRVLAEKFALAYSQKFNVTIIPPRYDIDWFEQKVKLIGGDLRRFISSVGTLGGGNHFIEIGISTKNEYWVTIHTGSRNLGLKICDYWQHKAIKNFKNADKSQVSVLIEQLRQQFKGDELYHKIQDVKQQKSASGVDEQLRWLEGEDAGGYLFDMIFAQMYAEVNRKYIARAILNILKVEPSDQIECIHNFIDFRDFIIRKGAIRSYVGERMIIPFNMRDGLLICEGKSNPEFNFSAPHGAGRILSRGKAKAKLSLQDFEKQMEGIYSTSVGHDTLDEAPDAYKSAALIEKAIEPTATILDKVKPLHNMKDGKGRSDD